MKNPTIKERAAPIRVAGQDRDAQLSFLTAGADLLQETTPLKAFDVYVVGFHCGKDDPGMQMEAHHYCQVVNNDLLQCVIFDGNTRESNLIGIEYIISERLFEDLPPAERPYWHPHNYEVLSGQLTAPGLPAPAETALMRRLMNSYGKTWHTWHTGRHDGEPGHQLPTGDPMLMWSFNRDGECDESLRHSRDRAMGLDPDQHLERRRELRSLAHPQHGVDAMADQFTDTTPVDGVVDVARVARA